MNNQKAIDISIILPIFNNEKVLPDLIEKIYNVSKKMTRSIEVIAIEDCGTDNSLGVLRSLRQKYSFLSVIENSVNIGQHKSILSGLKSSLGNYAVVMDSDLQDPPEYIFDLYNAIHQSDNELVFVLREGRYQSLSRMISSKFIKYLIYRNIGLPIQAGTFFIVRKNLVQKVCSIQIIDPYLTIMFSYFSKNTGYIKRMRNYSATSNYSTWMRLRQAQKAINCIAQIKNYGVRL